MTIALENIENNDSSTFYTNEVVKRQRNFDVQSTSTTHVELRQGPRDISETKGTSPMQPVLKCSTSSRVKHYRYSISTLIIIMFHGSLVRSFQACWFSKFKWLLVGFFSTRKEKAFTTQTFNDCMSRTRIISIPNVCINIILPY